MMPVTKEVKLSKILENEPTVSFLVAEEMMKPFVTAHTRAKADPKLKPAFEEFAGGIVTMMVEKYKTAPRLINQASLKYDRALAVLEELQPEVLRVGSDLYVESESLEEVIGMLRKKIAKEHSAEAAS